METSPFLKDQTEGKKRERLTPSTTLYLGLDPSNYQTKNRLIHCPIIQTIACPFDLPHIRHVFENISPYTHIIFTSKVAANLFFDCLIYYGHEKKSPLIQKKIMAIGSATADVIEQRGGTVFEIARESTQEGVIKMLKMHHLKRAFFLVPCSSLARPHLSHFLRDQKIGYTLCKLYETRAKRPKEMPDLDTIDEILFTSPSTVDAFQKIVGMIPKNKKLTCIGPITKKRLNKVKNKIFN